ncbi:MAG TPA: hypothetical protein V6D47_04170 [Oscillatoriaceae cyanobacterium]
MKRALIALLTVPLLTSGCAALMDKAMDAASDRAGNIIGDAIGDRVGNAAAGQATAELDALSPQMTQAYALGLFSVLFYNGGYAWDTNAYKVGDYTQWTGTDMGQGDFFEKALLSRDAQGREWWRVRAQQHEDGKVKEAAFEAFFSAPDANGGRKILRMRAKLPNQTRANEVPITEENQAGWVLRPRAKLTAESLQGATVGVEGISVAAGTYQARHVRYAYGAGSIDWWLSNQVPGGLVKYTVTGGDGKKAGSLQLYKVGTGAKPMLQ